MPTEEKTKKAKVSKPSDKPKPKITTVKLYHPNTVEHPNKIIYSSGEEYIKSIDDLAKVITDYGRENGKLVPFMIEGIENKVFLINCSNLYIVGYQNKDKDKLFAFKEGDLSYTSKTAYSFNQIEHKGEVKLEDLHTLGYMVAEAIRSTLVKEYISKYPDHINVTENILDNNIHPYKTTIEGIYDKYDEILKLLQIDIIAKSFSKSNEKLIQQKIEIFNKLPNNEEKLIKNLEKLDLEKLFGLKYLEDSQFPECGEYKFDKHIDEHPSGLGFDIYTWDHS